MATRPAISLFLGQLNSVRTIRELQFLHSPPADAAHLLAFLDYLVFLRGVVQNPRCLGFTGYGDADPPNVSLLQRGAVGGFLFGAVVQWSTAAAFYLFLRAAADAGSTPAHSTGLCLDLTKCVILKQNIEIEIR